MLTISAKIYLTSFFNTISSKVELNPFLFLSHLSPTDAFPFNFKQGIGVLRGGLHIISTYSVKLPGNSEIKLNMKVTYSPGLMTVFS